jgi:hypothetical protein
MSQNLFYRCLFAAVMVLLFVSCRTNRQPAAAREAKLFSLTNAVMDDQPVQVLKSTFGLRILPRKTDVNILFGTNASLMVSFNPNTLKPETILLTSLDSDGKPDQSVFDLNADGMPDMRFLKGTENRQLYYLGKWYTYLVSGTNNIITFEDKRMILFFNGTTWCENTNPPAAPKSMDVQERASNTITWTSDKNTARCRSTCSSGSSASLRRT